MKTRSYLQFLSVIVLIKVLVASLFPILSDEAHHILWGYFPSWGHADHPAMMGWFVAAFSWLGTSSLAYRFSSILVVLLVGETMRRLLHRFGAEKANLVAALYLASPLSLLNLVVTPEIPVMFFLFLTALALVRTVRTKSAGWAFVAGLLLSAALTSKYSALWLGAVAFYILVIRPSSRSLKLTMAFGLGCLPAFAIFYHYNVNNCWINLDRFISRMDSGSFRWDGPIQAVLFQLWVGTPWAWRLYFKRRETLLTFADYRKLFPLFYWIPFGFLFYVGLHNKIGAHWMSSFYPFFFMLLVECSTQDLRKALRGIGVFSALHLAALCVIPLWGVDKIGAKFPRYHHDVVISFYPKEICAKMHELAGAEAVLATYDYSQSSTLWIGCREMVARYGYGRLDGREFDKIVNYRDLDTKTVAILRQKPMTESLFKDELQDAKSEVFTLHGKTFYLVWGKFMYKGYRERVLRTQLERRYDPPARNWPNEKCYFKMRYFSEPSL